MVAMVEQKFDPALEAEPTLMRLVETASLTLEDETKATASPAVATWSLLRSSHADEPIALTIRDPELGVEASRTFSVADLQDFHEMEKDLLRLWGRLLERRSSARIERIMRSLREEGEQLQ